MISKGDHIQREIVINSAILVDKNGQRKRNICLFGQTGRRF